MDRAKGTAQQTRAQDSAFVQQCSLRQLRQQLPLSWPTPAGQPASPKKSYRSAYRYPWAEVCRDPGQVQAWLELGDIDLALRLVDFSGLRPVLAQRLGWKSGRGWEPFDPVSFFLLYLWQTSNRWTRQETLKHLAEQRYADYAAWFGFRNGVFPIEGGMRYFLTRLGSQSEASGEQVMVELEGNKIAVAVQQLNQLLVQAVELVRQVGLLSPAAWEQGLVCPDGQIHDAASRLHCISVHESCYQPCDPHQPRVCPAKAKGRQGCACDKACLKGLPPCVALPQLSYPPTECPYQAEEHRHGRVINVAETFPDGSLRLVRDIPVGSSTWKTLYHRARNAVESRNATFEAWGFKHLSVFGLLRAKAAIFLADVLDTLTTLARLVREATQADLSA